VFLLLTTVVIPAFSYYGSYTYFGGSGAGLGPAVLTGTLLANLNSGNGIVLLVALGFTAAFGLRSPLILVVAPTLLARFASDRAVYLEMKFYYDAPLMVVCFLALVVALQQRRIRRGLTAERVRVWWSSAPGFATAMALALLIDANVQTSQAPETFAAAGLPCQWCADAGRLIDEIPSGATVISDVSVLGQLADRHPALLVTPQWSDSTGRPLNADWVILYLDSDNFGPDSSWISKRRDTLLGQGYHQVDQASSLVLLSR